MFFEIAFSLLLGWLTWRIVITYSARRFMPPGPLPLPFIGNLYNTSFDPIVTGEKLWAKYGDVYTLSLPTGHLVALNTAEVAQEALVERKDDMAGRLPDVSTYPLNVVLEGKDILTVTCGETLNFRRKIFKTALHIFGSGINPAEERACEAVQSLVDQIKTFDDRAFSPRKYVGSAIVVVLWKWISDKSCSFDHPTVKALLEFNKKLMLITVQGGLYNQIPFLKYLPTQFMANLRRVLDIREEIFAAELQRHRETYVPGVIRDLTDSFIKAYEDELEKQSAKNIGSVDDVKGLMIDIVSGASDSTSSFVVWFILYLMLNQDLQRKLHKELDEVVGRDRAPRWEDAETLHLLQATICEVMRHSCFVPVAIHSAFRDTTVRGYKIPNGTTIAINFFNIHRDPKQWEEPKSFRPERFLDEDGKFVGWTRYAFMPFNIGRRACPGLVLGKMQVFAFVSTLLHHFEFEVPQEDQTPTLDYVMGATLSPKEYKVVARKRM